MATRDTLLSMLKADTAQWVSGEVLCKKLGISRAAVSKHMRALKDMGYDISSSTKKGYLLSGTRDKLIKAEIIDGLATRFFGKEEVLILDKTDSTNVQARQLAENGACHGSVVIAEDQSAGRGRKDRKWFSLPGRSIMMSLIIRPDLPPENAPRITLLAAVAAARAVINLTRIPVRIKWPNDLLVGNKKLAGISTGLSTDMDRVNYVILGIGLNVSTKQAEFPDELKPIATSVYIESRKRENHKLKNKKKTTRIALIKEFLTQFETYFDQMAKNGFDSILDEWKNLARIIGENISVDLHNQTLTGKVLDVDIDGVLILEAPDKTIHRILSGDVSLIED